MVLEVGRLRKVFALALGVLALSGTGLAAVPPATLSVEIVAGSVTGLVGVVLAGRLGGAFVEAMDLTELRTPIVVGFMTCGVTAGASLGVIGAGNLFGVTGNTPGCVLGALVGGLVGLFTEPLLYSLGPFELEDPFVEAMGMAAIALAPAIGATVGFNWGTSDP